MNSLLPYLGLLLLAFVQNVSFSLVSRSRNRDNMSYHIVASIFSNAVWFLTFRLLVTANMDLFMMLPYTVGTVLGGVSGVRISMWIEQKIGATSDSHIKKETVK
jgi:hypothetical protein